METSQRRRGKWDARASLKAAVCAMLIYGGTLEVFNTTDIAKLGYNKMTAWRAIKTLLDWGAIRRVAKHAYLISPEMKEKFLKEVAASPARARIVLFEAFGMDKWDERTMDSFLVDFKGHWRRRYSAVGPDGTPVTHAVT
ncbi:MAG: hypothetical protein ACRD6W_11280 [Nitrososphaerales archaeon]